MADTPNRKSRRVSQSTKEMIEKSAITLLSEKGYEATSMREIAEAAGVTKPVIYYYFKNKENLCHSIIRSGLEEFLRSLVNVCNDGVENPLNQLVEAVDLHFDFCKRRIEFVKFIYALNFGPDRNKINYDFQSYGVETFEALLRLMKQASHSGLIKPGKEDATVYYLRGIINTFVMRYVDGRGQLPPELARTIVTDILNGLGPQRSGPD